MTFSDCEKKLFLKTFTNILKRKKGNGPKNIYFKYLDEEICINVQGYLSIFEKYLIETYGDKAIETLNQLYNIDVDSTIDEFIKESNIQHSLKIKEYTVDLINDLFILKLELN